MNENAKAWIAALRSGRYEQCRQALRVGLPGNERFCCLGVACDISGQGRWLDIGFFLDREEESKFSSTDDWTKDDCVSEDCHLEQEFASEETRKWLGMKTVEGHLVLDGTPTTLHKLNDDGASFAAIADIIEEHADQLFEA